LDVSGEMFIFTYQMLAPHLIYRVVSKDGVVKEPVPITMPGPVMMHDFAISENYAIFMDLPLLLDPLVHAQSGIHHCPLSLYILQLNEGLNYWY
jgi:carotenoid cleavage dioxygenase-like enzyme